MNNSVLYHELTPTALNERIKACPVGYIPLGTLEWHCWHLPIGTDAIESYELFKMVAEEIGGVVFPPLFLGPDIQQEKDGKTYYGMEVYGTIGTSVPYPVQQLPGSCYWVSNEVFKGIIDGIAHNAQRNGFKILVGIGHCPSSDLFASMADEIKQKYDITVLTPDMGNPEVHFVPDHAAKVETSNIMYFRPELVHLENLSQNLDEYPLAIDGEDPRTTSSAELGKEVVIKVKAHIENLIKQALSVL